MIVTRRAREDDFVLLATLGKRAFYEAFGSYSDPADMQAYLDLAFDPSKIKQHLDDPSVIYFIAYYENDPVGYAKLLLDQCPKEIQGKKCIQLERIYALKAYIGKKIGKVLMEDCVQYSIRQNYEFLWLGVWQENKHAIDFYRKWGFEVIGYKQFVIGKEVNDDFVMALNLKKNTLKTL